MGYQSRKADRKSTLAVKTNLALDKIRMDINHHYQEVMQADGFTTADKVKNAYLGLGVKQDTFLALFAKHNQEFSRKVGYNRSRVLIPNTVRFISIWKTISGRNTNGMIFF